MAQPIFRIFKLGLNLDYEAAYDQVGYTNLTTSITQEAGTLAMFVNHVGADKTQQVVVELYADDAAYQVHAASQHFQAFAKLAGQALTSREVINLDAQALLNKKQLSITEANDCCAHLAHVQVSDSTAFADIVLPEMQASIDKEDGVLVMFAGTEAGNPKSWYFYEVYSNAAAYDSHRQTPHFKDYIARSAELVQDKELIELTSDLLVTKGQ